MAILNLVYWGTSQWWGWRQTEYTQLYLPLENDIIDYSWKDRTTRQSGVTFTTVGGIQSANFPATWYIEVWPTWFVNYNSWPKTISALFYVTSATDSHRRTILEFHNYHINADMLNIKEWTSQIRCAWAWQTYTDFTSWSVVVANKWTHVVWTTDTTYNKLYLDGVKIVETTWWPYPWGYSNNNIEPAQNIWNWRDLTSWGWDWLRWNLREIILENKIWSADDVSSYYNWIKAKLWF